MAHKIVIGKSALRDIENVLDWYERESYKALEKFLHNYTYVLMKFLLYQRSLA